MAKKRSAKRFHTKVQPGRCCYCGSRTKVSPAAPGVAGLARWPHSPRPMHPAAVPLCVLARRTRLIQERHRAEAVA